MTGCPRTLIHTTALQLLQILDKRFFGTIGPLQSELKDVERIGTLDVILSNAYCRSQMYLSKQLAQMRPELTMPMFSEITHRFQTARSDARTLLVQCLLPWLENVELVATSVPPSVPLSYIMVRELFCFKKTRSYIVRYTLSSISLTLEIVAKRRDRDQQKRPR